MTLDDLNLKIMVPYTVQYNTQPSMTIYANRHWWDSNYQGYALKKDVTMFVTGELLYIPNKWESDPEKKWLESINVDGWHLMPVIASTEEIVGYIPLGPETAKWLTFTEVNNDDDETL